MPEDFDCPVSFNEWALDITQMDSTGAYAFVPICGDAVVSGYTVFADRCPGRLIAVISDGGSTHVDQWTQQHPAWQSDYANPTH